MKFTMKFLSAMLAAAGMVVTSNAKLRLDPRQADPSTCGCTPSKPTEVVTEVSSYTITATITQTETHTESAMCSTSVQTGPNHILNSTYLFPVSGSPSSLSRPEVGTELSQPSQPSSLKAWPTTTGAGIVGYVHSSDVPSSAVSVPIGSINLLMSSSSSLPTYLAGHGSSMSESSVSPASTSSSPQGITITDITTVYTTMCVASSVVSTGGTTVTTTYDYSTISTVTSTIQSTVTIPAQESTNSRVDSEVSTTQAFTVSPSHTASGSAPTPSVYTTPSSQSGSSESVGTTGLAHHETLTLSTTAIQWQQSAGSAASDSTPIAYQTNYTSTIIPSHTGVSPVHTSLFGTGPPYDNITAIWPTGTNSGRSKLISHSVSTIFSTTEFTITSCAQTVTNCPVRSAIVMTSSFPVSTTVFAFTMTTSVQPSSTLLSPVDTSLSSAASGSASGPTYLQHGGPNSTAVGAIIGVSASSDSTKGTQVESTSLATLAHIATAYNAPSSNGIHDSLIESSQTARGQRTSSPSSTESWGTTSTTLPGRGQASTTVSYTTVSPTASSRASIPGYGPPFASGTEISPAQTTAPGSPGYISQSTAPPCILNSPYAEAFSDVTAELPRGSLGMVIVEDSVDSTVSGIMTKLNGKLESRALQSGDLPNGLPSTYSDATGQIQSLTYKGGMTLGNIVDWCAFLTVKLYNAGAVSSNAERDTSSDGGKPDESVSYGIATGGESSASVGVNRNSIRSFRTGNKLSRRARTRGIQA